MADHRADTGRLTGIANIQLGQSRQTSNIANDNKNPNGRKKEKIEYGANFIPDKDI